jgi:DNA-binding transcriptional ArsR family regulator
MDSNNATAALAALAQGTRLETFRLLIRAGADGLPAGIIARELDIPANTLSAHLSVLAHAGLVTSRREGRSIIYTADFGGMRELINYLLEDCCQGHPDICGAATHTRGCNTIEQHTGSPS